MALTGEKKKAWSKQYVREHREEMSSYKNEWRKTKYGRASTLLDAYKYKDKKYSRGETDLTPEWIVENIFSKPCAHCGETDWTKIGCNRLDNSKPHTKDNVEPCCVKCNNRLGTEYKKTLFKKEVLKYTLDDVLVKKYESLTDAASDGFNISHISACCNNKRKTYGGFKWKFSST